MPETMNLHGWKATPPAARFTSSSTTRSASQHRRKRRGRATTHRHRARRFSAPIWHVNGDDPEAVVRVRRWRTISGSSSRRTWSIDIVCYRRHGHNEGDDPDLHAAADVSKDQAAADCAHAIRAAAGSREAAHAGGGRQRAESVYGSFRRLRSDEEERARRTSCRMTRRSSCRPADALRRADQPRAGGTGHRRHHNVPGRFPSSSQAEGDSSTSAGKTLTGAPMDWAFGEALAFGSLVAGRNSGAAQRPGVRPRHIQPAPCRSSTMPRTAHAYMPLQTSVAEPGRFESADSPLSEFAVMGFEFGYQPGRAADAGAVGSAVW